MIFLTPSPDFTKSSVFSLMSTTIAIMANRNMAKKKVVKNFFSMYQSIFFMMVYPGKDKGRGELSVAKRVKIVKLVKGGGLVTFSIVMLLQVLVPEAVL